MMSSHAPLLLVSVGNTRTRYAYALDGQLDPSISHVNTDLGGLLRELSGEAEEVGGSGEAESPRGFAGARVVMASVNNPVADRIEAHLVERGVHVLRVGAGFAHTDSAFIDSPDHGGR